jgi:hypothetical protein
MRDINFLVEKMTPIVVKAIEKHLSYNGTFFISSFYTINSEKVKNALTVKAESYLNRFPNDPVEYKFFETVLKQFFVTYSTIAVAEKDSRAFINYIEKELNDIGFLFARDEDIQMTFNQYGPKETIQYRYNKDDQGKCCTSAKCCADNVKQPSYETQFELLRKQLKDLSDRVDRNDEDIDHLYEIY